MARSISVALVVVAAGACDDLSPKPYDTIAELALSPSDTTIFVDEALSLQLTAAAEDGSPLPGPALWATHWAVDGTLKGEDLFGTETVSITDAGVVTSSQSGVIAEVIARSAGRNASTKLRFNAREVRLRTEAVFGTQAAHNADGSTPLVSGRDALLRVYPAGDTLSFYKPEVTVTVYQDGSPVITAQPVRGGEELLDDVDQSSFDLSFNVLVPAQYVRPGLEVVVELDPGNAPLVAGSQLRFPEQGRQAIEVLDVPPLPFTIVPVIISGIDSVGILSWASRAPVEPSLLHITRHALPVGEWDIQARESVTTNEDLTTDAGWRQLLNSITLLMREEAPAPGRTRYYYGAFFPPPGAIASGQAWRGGGYLYRAGIGVTRDATVGHELGHNLSLPHAPCGNPAGVDQNYPYQGASIGAWGLDQGSGSSPGTLKSPDTYVDLMSYCGPEWISDYNFEKALRYRLSSEGPASAQDAARGGAQDGSVIRQPGLLVWGTIKDDGVELNPAFLLKTAISEPTGAGSYSLEGFDRSGAPMFSYQFTPQEISNGDRSFVFTIPAGADWEEALGRIVVSGPEGEAVLDEGTDLRWAIMRDPATGLIRGFFRDWDPRAHADEGMQFIYSRGLPGRRDPGGVR